MYFLIGGVDWEQYHRFMSGSTAVHAKGFTHIEPNGIVDNQRFELDVPPLFKYPSKLMDNCIQLGKGVNTFLPGNSVRDWGFFGNRIWIANILDFRRLIEMWPKGR